MVSKARSWLDLNKGFMLGMLIVIVSGIFAFSKVEGQTDINKDDINDLYAVCHSYIEKTSLIDFRQTTDIAVLKSDLRHIKDAIDKSNRFQEKMDEKIDRLLLRGD